MTDASSCSSGTVGTPTILIIDDDPVFRRVLTTVLEEEAGAISVRTADTGSAALGLLRAATSHRDGWLPDLVVLDYRLPDMQAPVILRHIRSETLLVDVPVLVVTQARWQQDEAAAMEAGATLFREKPSGVAELREVVVSSLLNGMRQRRAAASRDPDACEDEAVGAS